MTRLSEKIKSINVAMKVTNLDELKFCCQKPLEWWFRNYDYTEGKNGRHIYIKNGGPVLAVAHLDTHKHPGFHFNHYTRKGVDIVKTPTLDDRLGVYTILYLLPKLLGAGWADILLTEGEESGRSTAKDFTTDVQYNWIVEFDRKGSSLTDGDDVVLYGFEDMETRNLFKERGFKVGIGSISDISYMEDLGIKGFNIAIGYRDYHSSKAWFMPAEYEYNITERFIPFYNEMKNTKLPHTKRVYTYKSSYSTYKGGDNYGLYGSNGSNYSPVGYHKFLKKGAGYNIAYHYPTQAAYHVLGVTEKGVVLGGNTGAIFWAKFSEVQVDTWSCSVCLGFTNITHLVNGRNVCSKCIGTLYRACLNCGEPYICMHEEEICDDCVNNSILCVGDIVEFVKNKNKERWRVSGLTPTRLTITTEFGRTVDLLRSSYPDHYFRIVDEIEGEIEND